MDINEKVNEMREVINHQSKVIKQMAQDSKNMQNAVTDMKAEIEEMKSVLGFNEQKEKHSAFYDQLKRSGVTDEQLKKNPDLLAEAMRYVRRM